VLAEDVVEYEKIREKLVEDLEQYFDLVANKLSADYSR